MSSVLLSHFENGILTLTLNRPERLNALTWEVMRLLREALELAAADPGVRVVVLTGAGRGFCSGGDIRGAEEFDENDPISVKWHSDPVWRSQEMRASHLLRFTQASILLHRMPKPTIAMIQGPAAGAGLCLAAACDIRIASEEAVFTTAFANAARSGDFGGSYLLPRIVGPSKARELYLLCEQFDAQEALRIGFVSKVVPHAELHHHTRKFALRLARGPAAAYRYIKRNLDAAESMSMEQVIELESYNMMRCSKTEDAKELYRAAKEKSYPEFKGY